MSKFGLVAAGAAAGFGLAFAASHFAYGAINPFFGGQRALSRFGDAMQVVRENYLEEPKYKDLVEHAIDGMLTNLDAHSSYFDARTFEAMETKAAGAYGGIGLVVTVKDGTPKVLQAIDDTPASRAGLKKDDIIVSIDGVAMKDRTLDDVAARMRGTSGTPVALTVQRGNEKLIELKLIRQQIEVERLTYRREGDVGYIKIVAFSDRTDPDLREAVAALRKQIGPGIKGYVIDLRDNGGGVLPAAVDTADDFLDRGEIVSVRGRRPDDVERYDAHPGDVTDGKPVVVLVNGGTASASEILAGALQDHRRATIMGTLSFGKGSVQTIVPLDNGASGALHMTTARYYTPAGRSIQVNGIVPDIVVSGGPNAPQYEREEELPHHLPAEGPPPKPLGKAIEPEPGKAYTDFQLTTAIAFLHKTLTAGPSAPSHA